MKSLLLVLVAVALCLPSNGFSSKATHLDLTKSLTVPQGNCEDLIGFVANFKNFVTSIKESDVRSKLCLTFQEVKHWRPMFVTCLRIRKSLDEDFKQLQSLCPNINLSSNVTHSATEDKDTLGFKETLHNWLVKGLDATNLTASVQIKQNRNRSADSTTTAKKQTTTRNVYKSFDRIGEAQSAAIDQRYIQRAEESDEGESNHGTWTDTTNRSNEVNATIDQPVTTSLVFAANQTHFDGIVDNNVTQLSESTLLTLESGAQNDTTAPLQSATNATSYGIEKLNSTQIEVSEDNDNEHQQHEVVNGDNITTSYYNKRTTLVESSSGKTAYTDEQSATQTAVIEKTESARSESPLPSPHTSTTEAAKPSTDKLKQAVTKMPSVTTKEKIKFRNRDGEQPKNDIYEQLDADKKNVIATDDTQAADYIFVKQQKNSGQTEKYLEMIRELDDQVVFGHEPPHLQDEYIEIVRSDYNDESEPFGQQHPNEYIDIVKEIADEQQVRGAVATEKPLDDDLVYLVHVHHSLDQSTPAQPIGYPNLDYIDIFREQIPDDEDDEKSQRQSNKSRPNTKSPFVDLIREHGDLFSNARTVSPAPASVSGPADNNTASNKRGDQGTATNAAVAFNGRLEHSHWTILGDHITAALVTLLLNTYHALTWP